MPDINSHKTVKKSTYSGAAEQREVQKHSQRHNMYRLIFIKLSNFYKRPLKTITNQTIDQNKNRIIKYITELKYFEDNYFVAVKNQRCSGKKYYSLKRILYALCARKKNIL